MQTEGRSESTILADVLRQCSVDPKRISAAIPFSDSDGWIRMSREWPYTIVWKDRRRRNSQIVLDPWVPSDRWDETPVAFDV